jgi:phosphate transport system substrate-binding protein
MISQMIAPFAGVDMRAFPFPLALALVCSAVSAQTVIRVAALTAIPGILDPIKAHLEQDRNIRLVYKEENAADMFPDVVKGEVDVAMAGLTIEAWVDSMKAKGFPVKPASEYRSVQMGVDRICVLVNPDVVTGADMLILELSKAQIKALFTGKIKNWKELEGPDLPVTVLVSHRFVSTLKAFREKVMDGEPIVPTFKTIEGRLADLTNALTSTKGAISFGPLGLTTNSKIWSPSMAAKIERPFTLLISDKLDPEKKKAVDSMVEYMTGPGSKYIPK